MPFERTKTIHLDELQGCEGLWIEFRKVSTMPLAKHFELWVPSVEDLTDEQVRQRNLAIYVYHVLAWNIPDDRNPGSSLPIPSEDPLVLSEEWGLPAFIANHFAIAMVDDNFNSARELNLAQRREINSTPSSSGMDGVDQAS